MDACTWKVHPRIQRLLVPIQHSPHQTNRLRQLCLDELRHFVTGFIQRFEFSVLGLLERTVLVVHPSMKLRRCVMCRLLATISVLGLLSGCDPSSPTTKVAEGSGTNTAVPWSVAFDHEGPVFDLKTAGLQASLKNVSTFAA